MGKKKFKPWATLSESFGVWTLHYEIIQGNKKCLSLDATSREEALFEAAGITGMSENKITVED